MLKIITTLRMTRKVYRININSEKFIWIGIKTMPIQNTGKRLVYFA